MMGAVACAQPPTASVEAALARVEAIAAEGAIYAPQAYEAAQNAAAQLEAEMDAQGARFGLVRSYDRTAELATAVETAADNVQQAIEAEQQRLRGEATRMVADAEQALTESRQAIAELPEDEAAALESELASVDASLSEANSSLAGDRFVEAYEDAESALETATRLTASVAAVQAELLQVEEVAAERTARGGLDIPYAVLAGGEPLAAGPYEVRLTDEEAAPIAGETAEPTRWVEFVRDGTVVGRGLGIVISDGEIGEVAESQPPRNAARIDSLKGGEYVRLWLNRDGMNYLVHMPAASR